MRCFCAQAKNRLLKSEIYLSISCFVLQIVACLFITVCLFMVSITVGRPTDTTCWTANINFETSNFNFVVKKS